VSASEDLAAVTLSDVVRKHVGVVLQLLPHCTRFVSSSHPLEITNNFIPNAHGPCYLEHCYALHTHHHSCISHSLALLAPRPPRILSLLSCHSASWELSQFLFAHCQLCSSTALLITFSSLGVLSLLLMTPYSPSSLSPFISKTSPITTMKMDLIVLILTKVSITEGKRIYRPT